MATCDVCHNDYDKTFEISTHDGERLTFDSFECAIHRIAPTCAHCSCRVLGHGIEVGDEIYCCANCARLAEGATDARDRVGSKTG